MFVYLITNLVNGKKYVGKTVRRNLSTYFNLNLRSAERGQHNKPHLYNAIRKHGRYAFSISEICQPPSEQLALALERWYIKLYNSNDSQHGYNLTRGGDGVSGMKQSDLSIQKVRDRSIGNTWRRGSKPSDETKRLISESKKHAYQNGLRVWNAGLRWSDDAKRKMSESAKRRWSNMSTSNRLTYEIVGRKSANKRWNHERQ